MLLSRDLTPSLNVQLDSTLGTRDFFLLVVGCFGGQPLANTSSTQAMSSGATRKLLWYWRIPFTLPVELWSCWLAHEETFYKFWGVCNFVSLHVHCYYNQQSLRHTTSLQDWQNVLNFIKQIRSIVQVIPCLQLGQTRTKLFTLFICTCRTVSNLFLTLDFLILHPHRQAIFSACDELARAHHASSAWQQSRHLTLCLRTMCSREIFTKKCQQQQIFYSDLKGAWHYNHVTFTPIAQNIMLYCRLIYMLSILCVRLTIKVEVGIPESFKVGWYPPPPPKKNWVESP